MMVRWEGPEDPTLSPRRWWLLVVSVLLWSGCTVKPPCDDTTEECLSVSELAQGTPLGEAYHLFDREGQPLADVGGVLRDWTPLDEIPVAVRDAWIAVEDRRFREHEGVDIRGVVRAAAANLRDRGVAEGASTIPMQLVRVLWPEGVSRMKPWSRKMFEAHMARRLVRELDRERVLELYLNGIYLGDGRYGVAAAARHFFDTSVDSLSLAQTATLVGLTKTPERYHPGRHPRRARARRDLVIEILAREGLIQEQEAERAAGEALAVRVDSLSVEPRARSYATAAVRRELRFIAPDLVGETGLKVHTTIDRRVQAELMNELPEHLARIERGEFGEYLGVEEQTQAATVVLETTSGEMLGLIGGRSFSTSEFNRAVQARRPVGSLVKPILLAAALEHGLPATRVLSTGDLQIETPEGVWNPRDHVDSEFLFPQQMVVRSSNRAAVRLGQALGIGRFIETAALLGVEGPIGPFPSSFLGSFEATMVEMTSVFAAFENGGFSVDAHLIRWVESAEGDTLWSREPLSRRSRILQETTADQVLHALQGVVADGTGRRAVGRLGGLAAGKTGTTNEGRDAWFVGLRPGLAAGVWVGFDEPRAVVEGGSGGLLAAPFWSTVMSGVEAAGWGDGEWDPDESLVRVRLAVQERTDTVASCWGRGSRPTLVRESNLTEIEICDPRPRWTGASFGGAEAAPTPSLVPPLLIEVEVSAPSDSATSPPVRRPGR